MISLLNSIYLVFGLIIFIFSLVIFAECVLAISDNDDGKIKEIVGGSNAIAVLIPAHNEAEVIESTIRSILPQLGDGVLPKTIAENRLIVIADNCTDNTAAIAQSIEGVTVIERQNQELRGKGYAIDYGVKYLADNPPEVVVMVDADCMVRENTIPKIAALAKNNHRPVQATYLMSLPKKSGIKDQVSAFALTVKNLVRPLGLTQVGLPCLLNGSGMAFPWSVISQASLANSKTVDDMQLGIDLAIAGHPPLYCSQGLVQGRLMENQFAQSQRSRWEHGHLETLLTETPRLLQASLQQKRFDLFALALELSVPPLSLLVILWLIGTVAALAIFWGLEIWFPLIILSLSGLLIISSILLAWTKFGRQQLPLKNLILVPFYIFWKIPLYLAFPFRRQSKWLKTERD